MCGLMLRSVLRQAFYAFYAFYVGKWRSVQGFSALSDVVKKKKDSREVENSKLLINQ